jgi:hypothetical protein
VVVFNNVLISALFNNMPVIWSMFCLEHCICHCCEYFLLTGDDTWWSLMMF